eukprot:809616-Amphidinium_carterae.1
MAWAQAVKGRPPPIAGYWPVPPAGIAIGICPYILIARGHQAATVKLLWATIGASEPKSAPSATTIEEHSCKFHRSVTSYGLFFALGGKFER